MAKQIPDFIEGKVVELENVELRHPYFTTPDTGKEGVFTKKPEWCCTIILDDDLKDSLEALGFNVREKDGEHFITARRACETLGGKKQDPPTVWKDRETLWDGPDLASGSIVCIKLWCKYTNPRNPTQVVPYIDAALVVDAKEWIPDDTDDSTPFTRDRF